MPGITDTSHRIPHALSSSQERKLVDYLDTQFLEITRNFKKRSDPSSNLPSLSDYLNATHTLLSLILQIPPIDPSTSLRTTLLLRLTGEVMDSILGYKPEPRFLSQLLEWLGDLDNAWLAVLRSQTWDTETAQGVDLIIDQEGAAATPNIRSTPMNQTERARLRSLLIGGTARMEEWLVNLGSPSTTAETDSEGLDDMLERLGLQQGFDDLFSGTLSEMGSLGGSVNNPEGMEGTC
ncbi:hypothetical protein NLI96_g8382 [Meripilus lineatus]|uniref:Uncharacterized protein n=1 Tax=Meripilus lineatus TaxID=2056292 RepID=A0AAD5UXF7_9APHY|nr:hypothetical protein NLI96_g8382 [Physisporinus lineatus]